MHCCGNIVHDTMANLPVLLPILAPFVVWLRAKTKAKPCEHEHEHEHGAHQ